MKGIWNAYNTEIFGFIHETKGLIGLICINIPHHLIWKPAWHLWCADITLLTYSTSFTLASLQKQQGAE